MLKYIASTNKDIILLLRDRAGLAMLFIMPAALIIIMTLLQDSTFKALEERQLPILVRNLDNDTFGINIIEGLKKSKFFKVTIQDGKGEIAINKLKLRVTEGEFQIGIIIHPNATKSLQNNIRYNIIQQLPDDNRDVFGDEVLELQQSARIEIYFDPVTKSSFKQSVTSALHEFSSSVEAKIMFGVYSSLFNDMLGMELKNKGSFDGLVSFETKYASTNDGVFVPNSVQHNVPAWTIFAMFFIVIPLAGNIIKERRSGVYTRIRITAGSYLPVIMGKVTTYLMIGLLQALTMMLIGVYLLPLMGLPRLILGDNYLSLIILTISVSLAATGYGVIIGSFATSQEQSSIFGSISVVILAAIGGIWVPVFVMSNTMQLISNISPLNWALSGYYDVFLRNSGVSDIIGYVVSLFMFFVICISVSLYYDRIRKET
jgi:ABC-2 type transport system permease protein